LDRVTEWYDEIYHTYHRTLVRTARGLLRDHQYAEDMVQEVFITLLTEYKSLKDTSNLLPWLMTVLRNKIMSENQKVFRFREAAIEPDFHPPAPDSFSDSFYDEMPETLSREDRELLYLHYEAGYTYQELAGKLGCSSEAVGMRLLRARHRCQKLMGKEDEKKQKRGAKKTQKAKNSSEPALDSPEFDKYEGQEVKGNV